MTEQEYGAGWTKDRSLKCSVKDAWLLFVLRLKVEMRAFVPFVLLLAMVAAFCVEMWRCLLAGTYLPLLRMVAIGADAGQLQALLMQGGWYAAGAVLSMLLVVLALYWHYGRVFSYLHLTVEGDTEGVESLCPRLVKADRKLAWRTFSIDMASVLLLVVVQFLFGALSLRWHWCSWLTLPFVAYITVAVRAARHEYVFEGRSFKQSLKLAYGRKWGRAFLTDVVCMWPVLAVRMVALLPMIIGFYASVVASASWMIGDDVKLPDCLPLVLFLLNVVGIAVCVVSGLFMVYARSMRLHHASAQMAGTKETTAYSVKE